MYQVKVSSKKVKGEVTILGYMQVKPDQVLNLSEEEYYSNDVQMGISQGLLIPLKKHKKGAVTERKYKVINNTNKVLTFSEKIWLNPRFGIHITEQDYLDNQKVLDDAHNAGVIHCEKEQPSKTSTKKSSSQAKVLNDGYQKTDDVEDSPEEKPSKSKVKTKKPSIDRSEKKVVESDEFVQTEDLHSDGTKETVIKNNTKNNIVSWDGRNNTLIDKESSQKQALVDVRSKTATQDENSHGIIWADDSYQKEIEDFENSDSIDGGESYHENETGTSSKPDSKAKKTQTSKKSTTKKTTSKKTTAKKKDENDESSSSKSDTPKKKVTVKTKKAGNKTNNSKEKSISPVGEAKAEKTMTDAVMDGFAHENTFVDREMANERLKSHPNPEIRSKLQRSAKSSYTNLNFENHE